jgi:redox-sensitive bicupin YhaK (pirin superfamily)
LGSVLARSDLTLDPGAALPVDSVHEERAVYVVSGVVEIAGTGFPAGRFVVLRSNCPITIHNAADETARLVIVGGESMDGPRYLWWNFVSSRRERIEQAQADWNAGRFDLVPGDSNEFIPLPEDTKIVDYP